MAQARIRLPAVVAGLAAALAVGAARADEEPRTVLELSAGGAPLDREVEGGRYGIAAGLSLRVRAGPVEIGPVLSFSEGRGGDVVSDSLRLGGAVARAVSSGPWRLTVLAEGGLRRVFDVHEVRYETEGPSLGGWGIEQRASVTLPYAGLRAGIAWRKTTERSWENLWCRLAAPGVSLFLRRDLARGTAVVDYVARDPFRSSPATTASYRVGGWSAGVTVDLVAGW
jgi:hypothetical protein